MEAIKENLLDEDVGDAAEEVVQDVRRGARRVGQAVRNGAEALDKAVRPSFGEQLKQMLRSMIDNPSQTINLAMDLVRDHPLASAVTITVTAAVVKKGVSLARR